MSQESSASGAAAVEADDTPVFVIGLAMAGAISAGAYTAGVLDFLVRALAAHEEARQRALGGKGDGPRHRVVLKVMSGASAGGVCSALGALAMTERLKIVPPEATDDPGEMAPPQPVLKPLHEIWVDRLDLIDGPHPLLARDDIHRTNQPTAALPSLLNAAALERHADEVLGRMVPDAMPKPWLSSELELFLTVTLLEGVPYRVLFDPSSPTAGHEMADHAFARHFRLSGAGSAPRLPSAWLTAWHDAGVPLTAAPGGPLGPAFVQVGGEWGQFRETALATGAFPIGLKTRELLVDAGEVHWPRGWAAEVRGGAIAADVDWESRPIPTHPDFRTPGRTVPLLAVDGGVCNNEPFELARFTLRRAATTTPPSEIAHPEGRKGYLLPNPRDARVADRAVILIDPFPEGPVHEARRPGLSPDVFDTVSKLIPTLLNQARLKPDELLDAANEAVRSRFLIAPSRPHPTRPDEVARGSDAIACGALGGFGGFIDRGFRRHDFELGQRNCQSFLLSYFGLDPSNPVFGGWTGGVQQAGGMQAVVHLPPELRRRVRLPDWPSVARKRLDKVHDRIERRVDAVLLAAMETKLESLRRLGGWLLGRVAGAKVKAAIRDKIEGDLKLRGQSR